MNRTDIDWADYTWNPVTGCLGPKGDGLRCHYCYAHRLANGRLKKLYLANPHVLAGDPADPFAPRWWPKRMDGLRTLHKPSRIFVCDMADLFGGWIPNLIIEDILESIRYRDDQVFMVLTRWPQNLARWNPWPSNAWVGATATDVFSYLQAEAGLVHVDAPVRFISFEPLLERIGSENLLLYRTDWIIIGGQTGPGARSVDREAVRELILAADERHIPVFLKENLKHPGRRQEWPTTSQSGERRKSP